MKQKEQAVRLSGVVYVKDPRDIQELQNLKTVIGDLRSERNALRRDLAKAEERVKGLDRSKKIFEKYVQGQNYRIQRGHEKLDARKEKIETYVTLLKKNIAAVKQVKTLTVGAMIQGRHYDISFSGLPKL